MPANDYSPIITALSTVILVLVTCVYVVLTNGLLKHSKTDTKIAYLRDRLEKYYIPLSSFFDLCVTDEAFNCNPEDPPTKISFDSSILDVFQDIHKYQYLACPKLKSKMSDFVLMLLNQHTDEKEEQLYLLFHSKVEEDSQIITIKNVYDIKEFVEVRDLVFDDIEMLIKKLDELTAS